MSDVKETKQEEQAVIQEEKAVSEKMPESEEKAVLEEKPTEEEKPAENEKTDQEEVAPVPGKSKKKKTAIWITLIVFVLLAILLGAGYYMVSDHYKTHFLPGTILNQIDCSNLEAAEAAALLEAQSLTYHLEVTGRDGQEIGSLTAQDIGLRIVNTLPDVEAILADQNYYGWPKAVLAKNQTLHELTYATEFDKDKVLECVRSWDALDEEKMEAPQNAYISEYSAERKGYEIIPETRGNLLDVEAVEEHILLSVEKKDTTLDLEKEGYYVLAQVTEKDRKLQNTLTELNKITGTCITYDWNGSEVILDGDTIHEWIVGEEELTGIDGKQSGEILLDEEAVAAFVAGQAKKYDTYGKHRNFTTALGETVYVLNGGYGWKTEREEETQALIGLIQEGAVAEREPIYWVTGKKKGADDIGDSYVEIDLTHQHLYLYWKGELVLETDFVSGDMAKGNVTPGGLYRLTYKTTNAVLRGRDYATPVSYWMPFNGNIGMHDATWRDTFGGDIYLTDGSHGCINLPLDKARDIYAYVSTGFPIICYYY